MGILLGFAPFIVFALLSSVSVSLGLWLAFAAAFVITIRDFVEAPTLRLLDAGGVVVLGLMALFTGFIDPSISLQVVRLIVEASFLALALISLLFRRPLTLAYGHEHVPDEAWNTPAFRRANYLLTAGWALAFAVMALADAAASVEGPVSLSLDLAIGLAVLGLAIIFTVRYPARLAIRHGHAPAANSPARKS